MLIGPFAGVWIDRYNRRTVMMAADGLVALSSVILGALFPLLVRVHFIGEAWHNSVVELAFSAGLMVSSLIMGVWGGLRKRFLMISLAGGCSKPIIDMLLVLKDSAGEVEYLTQLKQVGYKARGLCYNAVDRAKAKLNLPMPSFKQEVI